METDNSKERVQVTALSLFAAKGYDAVSVQEICEAAKITKPTLYYFFKSKQGLLEAIVNSTGAELLKTVKEASVYDSGFVNGLTKILTAQIAFAKQNPEFYRLHVSLLNAPDDCEAKGVYAPLQKKLSASLDNFFVQSSAEFGNMRKKEKLYARIFSNTVQTVALQCALKKIKVDDQLIFQIVHSFVYGVAS